MGILTLAKEPRLVSFFETHPKWQLVGSRDEAPDEDIPDGDPDPEAVLAASQDAARMRACVGALPERQRAVIHLAFFEDLTLSEVAEVEAVPVGTVKSRIHHAKQMLMRCLSKGA